MNFKVVVSVVGLTCIVMGFQNCSKTKFGAADGSSGVVGKSNISETLIPIEVDESEEMEEAKHEYIKEPEEQEENESTGKKEVNGSKGNDDYVNHDGDSEDDRERENDSDLVACILDGPGKSIKLGILSEELNGNHSVSRSVCVTRKACLTEVSKGFKVIGAVKRGYCNRNPNVQVLGDKELKNLMDSAN